MQTNLGRIGYHAESCVNHGTRMEPGGQEWPSPAQHTGPGHASLVARNVKHKTQSALHPVCVTVACAGGRREWRTRASDFWAQTDSCSLF